MNEDPEPYHPQETANSKDICRRPGCGTVNCTSHCICPHCPCHRDAIGHGKQSRWCRRCKKGKCGRPPAPRGLKKQACCHEGCRKHPCPEHCQCKDCFPCQNPPMGFRRGDAKCFPYRCSKCEKKRCCPKAEPPSSSCTEPPQEVEVPMSVDSSRCCFPPRRELLQVGKDGGLLLPPALQAPLPTA
jgi:hypothetical protein